MTHILALTACVLSLLLPSARAETRALRTEANVPVEITFTSQKSHADPFNTVEMDVVFTDQDGLSKRVPAFWAGADKWKVRYASRVLGAHQWRTECNDVADSGLHGVTGDLKVTR